LLYRKIILTLQYKTTSENSTARHYLRIDNSTLERVAKTKSN